MKDAGGTDPTPHWFFRSKIDREGGALTREQLERAMIGPHGLPRPDYVLSPAEFQMWVDAGWINPDGTLRRRD